MDHDDLHPDLIQTLHRAHALEMLDLELDAMTTREFRSLPLERSCLFYVYSRVGGWVVAETFSPHQIVMFPPYCNPLAIRQSYGQFWLMGSERKVFVTSGSKHLETGV